MSLTQCLGTFSQNRIESYSQGAMRALKTEDEPIRLVKLAYGTTISWSESFYSWPIEPLSRNLGICFYGEWMNYGISSYMPSCAI